MLYSVVAVVFTQKGPISLKSFQGVFNSTWIGKKKEISEALGPFALGPFLKESQTFGLNKYWDFLFPELSGSPGPVNFGLVLGPYRDLLEWESPAANIKYSYQQTWPL
jgi:hypothetical protein